MGNFALDIVVPDIDEIGRSAHQATTTASKASQ